MKKQQMNEQPTRVLSFHLKLIAFRLQTARSNPANFYWYFYIICI